MIRGAQRYITVDGRYMIRLSYGAGGSIFSCVMPDDAEAPARIKALDRLIGGAP